VLLLGLGLSGMENFLTANLNSMGTQVKKEISIMKMVRHVHVVSLKEVLASRTKIFIVLELVTGGELFDKIVAVGKFNEVSARKYFQQLVAGTAYCHKQGVCHRDLKPENLLLDEHENLKISDFGLSSLYEQAIGETDRRTLLHTTCGTPNYVAPEVLADKGYDGAMADTWSIGVILFVFLAGFLPFDEPTMNALFKKIQRAEFTYPTWFADDVKDLIGRILVVDPKQRLSIPQIRQHPWWKKDGPYAHEDPTQDGELEETPGSAELLDDVDEEDGHRSPGASTGAPATSSTATDTKRINAFDLINMCSGPTVAHMFQTEAEKRIAKSLIAPSSKPFDELMKYLQEALKNIPGFVEQSIYNEDMDKIRAVYDLGHGQVHVKVAMEIVDDDLIMVVFKRARGDLISFGKIWDSVAKLASSIH
jgi:serine/threonine protein kinase